MRAACLALCLGACAVNAAPVPPRAQAGGEPARARANEDSGQRAVAERSEAGARLVSSDAADAASPSGSALPAASDSTSIGSPTDGQLQGGVPLPLAGAGFRFNSRRDSGARYGTVEVIGAIERAAGAVQSRFPGSDLVVNDISLREGGRIPHHGSHRAGRDADILFYLRGDDGAFTPSVGAPIDPAGVGFDFKELSDPADDVRVHFDAERTWLFVAALLEDAEAEVQRIFVVEHLRLALLREARRVHARPETLARFEDVTCQPSYPHDDHLHVRWFCSFEDLKQGCQDLPPLYPWRERALDAEGLQPVLASRTRSSDPAPVTTQAEADREVKRLKPHKDVLAFLARRKAWEKEPHPGRPYCR